MDLARLRPMLAVSGHPDAVRVGHRYEFKWDGVRVLAFFDADGRLTLRSRNGVDVTGRYPELVAHLPTIEPPAVADGEVVALDEAGRPSFAALQHRMHVADVRRAASAAAAAPVAFLAFDLLAVGGVALLDRPLDERRAALAGLDLSGTRWSVPPDTDDLEAALSVARQRGLEGVVAKRIGSSYRPGVRSRDWIKLRLTRRQEVVVGGWRPGRGSLGGRIGSLLVGVHDATGLRYAGGVGSGISGDEAVALAAVLEPSGASPFVDPVPHRDAVFVAPTVAVEVRFSEWTPDGRLRHPVYLGRRDDVDPATVGRDPGTG